MGPVRQLFDTNILIDCLDGFAVPLEEVEQSIHPSISIICWMEVMVGPRGAAIRQSGDSWLRLSFCRSPSPLRNARFSSGELPG
jgi:hypothetical protein